MRRFLFYVALCLVFRTSVSAAPIVLEDFSGCVAGWHWVPDNTTAHARLVDYWSNSLQPAWDSNWSVLVPGEGAPCYRIGRVGAGFVGHHVIAGTNGVAAYLERADYRVTLRFRPLSATSENELILRFQDNANKYVIHIGAWSSYGHDYENATLLKVVNGVETQLFSPFPRRTIPGIVSNVEYEASAVVVSNRVQFAMRRTDGLDGVDGWAIDYTDAQAPFRSGGFGFGVRNNGSDFSFFTAEAVGRPAGTVVSVH